MTLSRVRRPLLVAGVMGVLVFGFGADAQATSTSASMSGTYASTTFSFTSGGAYSVSVLTVKDTSCDGKGSRANFETQDAYGSWFTYSNHDNYNGCNKAVSWYNLSGSNGMGVHYLHLKAHTIGTSSDGYSPNYHNPYF